MSFLNGMAVASATTVVSTVLAAITLLPAMLASSAGHPEGRRERREPAPPKQGFWTAGRDRGTAAGLLSSSPWPWIVVLSVPVLSLRLGSSDAGNNPASHEHPAGVRPDGQGLRPRSTAPAAAGRRDLVAADQQALASLAPRSRTLQASPVWRLPHPAGRARRHRPGRPATSPQSKATADLITHLRHDLGARRRTRYQLKSTSAAHGDLSDFADVLTGKLPLFITVIVRSASYCC